LAKESHVVGPNRGTNIWEKFSTESNRLTMLRSNPGGVVSNNGKGVLKRYQRGKGGNEGGKHVKAKHRLRVGVGQRRTIRTKRLGQ